MKKTIIKSRGIEIEKQEFQQLKKTYINKKYRY